jgi:hypothetical protein
MNGFAPGLGLQFFRLLFLQQVQGHNNQTCLLRLFLNQGECLEDDAFTKACFGDEDQVTFVV